MKFLMSVAVLLSLCLEAGAEFPVVDIQGPTVANVGQPLILDARQSVAKHFSWKAVPAEVSPGVSTIEVIEGGQRCVVSTMPGKYHIILAVATEEGVVQKVHTVEVIWGELKPDKEDKDKDDKEETVDPPEPDVFREQFGLATKVKSWLVIVPVGKRGRQLNLSLAFRTAGQQAEKISDLKKVEGQPGSNLSADLVREALGGEVGNWAAFFDKLGTEMANLEADGTLSTLDDFKQAWLEVSEGLR